MFVVKQRYKNLPFYIFSISLDDFKEITLKFTIVEEKIQHLTGVFSAVEKRRIKISSLIGTFELIDDYIIDEDARTQYLQEHSTPKTATTISLYFLSSSG